MSSEALNDQRHCEGDGPGNGPAKDATAVVRFRIDQVLRFLSHAETMRLWQRACARARLCVKYTQGFNPHPKMSLPLPRAVGVAAEDELLVLRLFRAEGFPQACDVAARRQWEARTAATLDRAVPAGVEVLSVELMRSGVSFRCRSAVYEFPVPGGAADFVDRVKEATEKVLTSRRLMIERRSPKSPGVRRVDVRPFLQSIEWQGNRLRVTCHVTAAGSARVDEMMEVLGLEAGVLAGPIRRTGVQWNVA
jgi:radical SAM-linked protein